MEIEAEIMNLLWYRFKRSGIEIPFPIRNVNLTQITPEARHIETEKARGRDHGPHGKGGHPLTALQIGIEETGGNGGRRAYATGEFPVRQGQAGDTFFIIKKGRVEVIVEKALGESAAWRSSAPETSSAK